MESVSSEPPVLLSKGSPPINFPSSLHTIVTPNNGTIILLLTVKGYENALFGSPGRPTSMARTGASVMRPESNAHISTVTDTHFTARLRDEGGWFVITGGVSSPAGVLFFFFDMAGVLDYLEGGLRSELALRKYSLGPVPFSSTNRQFHNAYQRG